RVARNGKRAIAGQAAVWIVDRARVRAVETGRLTHTTEGATRAGHGCAGRFGRWRCGRSSAPPPATPPPMTAGAHARRAGVVVCVLHRRVIAVLRRDDEISADQHERNDERTQTKQFADVALL